MKRSYMELSKKVWRKLEGNTPIFDENVAKFSEWTDGSIEYMGMRNTSDQSHGIVRKIDTASSGIIIEGCFKNDLLHGLCLVWTTDGTFSANIYQDGFSKGNIAWDINWFEYLSDNRAYCLDFFNIDDFKP